MIFSTNSGGAWIDVHTTLHAQFRLRTSRLRGSHAGQCECWHASQTIHV